MLPGILVSKKWSTDHTKRAKWKTDISKELLYEFLQQQFDNLLYRKFLIFSLNAFYSPDIRKKPHSFTSPIYHLWIQAQVLTSLCMKVQSCSAPLVELCAFPYSPQIPHQLWLGQWMAGWCQQTPEDFVRSGKSLWPESGVCSKQSHQAAGKAFLCSHQIAFDLKKINNSPVKESLQSAPNILTSIFFLLVCFLMKWFLIVPVV